MAAKKPTAKTTSKTEIIKPILRFNEEVNPLETLWNNDNPPVITSVGIFKSPTGWVSCVVKTKGTEVIEVNPGQPNMRGVAIGEAKFSFEDCFEGME